MSINAAESYGSDYSLESVLIESERLNKSVEARASVSDLDVYEHLDKPYLTATLSLLDTANIYAQMDLLGAETVTMRVKSTREGARAITKKFIITKVIVSQKANESSDLLIIHLIEDIAYFSNLLNVNRSFTGNAHDIIQKISENFLDNREVVLGNRNPKQNMKLIVPNMNPLEAMIWIKNKAKTIEGLPFYLFSSFTNDNFWFVDLGTMIEEPVINPKTPYRYGSFATKTTDANVKRRIIGNYVQKNVEDLYSIIEKGLIGGHYEFIDVLTNQQRVFHHDIMLDALDPLIEKGIIQRNQPNVSYSADYTYKEKAFNEYDSRSITRIGGNQAFRINEEGSYFPSYGESIELSDYKLYIMADALDQLMKKVPLIIDVPGIDFIDGDKISTIGCTIRLEFPINLPNAASDVDQVDIKKSGDYLIFAARHRFKVEKYDLSLSCLKLANYKSKA